MNIVQVLIDALPPLLFGVGLVFLWSFVFPSRHSLFLLAIISSAVLIACLFLAWFFRDGMGPDAIESTGLEAARRIGVGAAAPLAVWLVLNALAFARYKAGRGRAA